MAVVAAAILCVVFDNKDNPQYQNLTNVYHFIANMCKTENKVMPIDAYMKKLPESHPAKALIAIAKIAPDRMGGSFYTSALTTLRLFITNDVYRVTCQSEFSLDDLARSQSGRFSLFSRIKRLPIILLLRCWFHSNMSSLLHTRNATATDCPIE